MANARGAESGVCVAIRVRPFVSTELERGDRNVVVVGPGEPTVGLSEKDKKTFDFVFGPDSTQAEVFEQSVTNLVDGIFDGYNATILAYGQTGSGKTYTMGSAFDIKNKVSADKLGIIPRAVLRIFDNVEAAKGKAVEQGIFVPEFEVQVQFVEVYMDDIRDLLFQGEQQRNILLVEKNNAIVMKGASSRTVTTVEHLMEALAEGSRKRTVAATKMNDLSSRSHAIFSVHLRCRREKPGDDASPDDPPDIETVTTKFHFVDLAGSECMDQTGAEGHVAKEGIDINMGLFHLGQVINALTSRRSYIPYRSCKLTRLLQDSLGGNSKTLMIACISPSSANERHSSSTLSYASNAKKIVNQVSKNVSSSASVEALLRKRINALEAELLLYQSGRCVVGQSGEAGYSDLYKENLALTKERDNLKLKVESLTATVEDYQVRMVALSYRDIDVAVAQRAKAPEDSEHDPVADLAKRYIEDNQKLNDQLTEARKEAEILRRQAEHLRSCLANNYELGTLQDGNDLDVSSDVQEIIADAIKHVSMLKHVTASEENVERPISNTEEIEDECDEEMETDNENEEDDDDDDDSMDEQEKQEAAIEAEKENERDIRKLIDVNADISTYKKIINDLVENLRRQAELKSRYDAKCKQLTEQIASTEKERDKLMEAIQNEKNRGNKKDIERRVKETADEYERRIKELKKEHSRIKSLEKSLDAAMKKQEKTEADLRKYRDMVANLQQTKNELKSKMNEDNKRAQESVRKANKRIRVLETEAARQDVQVKKLRTQDQRKIDQLQREIAKLQTKIVKEQPKSQLTPRSPRTPVSSRTRLNTSRAELNFRTITNAVLQEASHIVLNNRRAKETDALIKRRTELETKKRDLEMKKQAGGDPNVVAEMDMMTENISREWSRLEKQIKDQCAQIETTKTNSAANVINECKTLPETKFIAQELSQELLKYAVNHMEALQEVKDVRAELTQLRMTRETEELYDMLSLDKVQRPTSFFPEDPENTDTASVKSNERDKERRRTKGPMDLLFDNAPKKNSSKVPTLEPLRELNGNISTLDDDDDDDGQISVKNDGKVVKQMSHISKHGAEILCMDANDIFLATGSRDRYAAVSDIETSQQLLHFGIHENSVRLVKFIPNSSMMVTCSAAALRVFDLREHSKIIVQFSSSGVEAQPELRTEMFPRVEVLKYGERFISAGDVDVHGNYFYINFGTDGIRCFDMRSMQLFGGKINLPVPASPYESEVTTRSPRLNYLNVSSAEDGSGEMQILATHSDHPAISVVRVFPDDSSHDQVRNIQSIPLDSPSNIALGVGNTIFIANSGGQISRYRGTRQEYAIPEAHFNPISSMCFMNTRDGSLLASGCNGGVVNFWRYEGIRSMIKYSTISNLGGSILSMTSNTNKLFVAQSSSCNVAVFDINQSLPSRT